MGNTRDSLGINPESEALVVIYLLLVEALEMATYSKFDLVETITWQLISEILRINYSWVLYIIL